MPTPKPPPAVSPSTIPPSVTPVPQAGAVLRIDLAALTANYLTLCDLSAPAQCAPVLKGDAYGIGLAAAATALLKAGARLFCVAHIFEAIALRALAPEATIWVLHGPPAGTEADFTTHDLLPVLNTPAQVAGWRRHGAMLGRRLGAILHVDTGMNRLGLQISDYRALAAELAAEPATARTADIDIQYVLSHLTHADQASEPLNRTQRNEFAELAGLFPNAKASFANSSGMFLGADFHFDLTRAGVALYGINPTPGQDNPMAEVVHLQAPIVQIREIDSQESVGYGASHHVKRPSRIATVAVGYADGYLRGLSNRGFAAIAGETVPLVGRVSMDLITLDITDIDTDKVQTGTMVDLLGGDVELEQLAARADTIAYELLTNLGRRYARQYRHAGSQIFVTDPLNAGPLNAPPLNADDLNV